MNIKMKGSNFLWLVFCCTHAVYSQQGTVSTGGDAISQFGSVSYSVGQLAYTAIYNETGSVNEGLQQAIQNTPVSTHEFFRDDEIKLYPNPADRVLYLQLNHRQSSIQDQYTYAKVFDVKGNLLMIQEMMNSVNAISIEKWPEAMYLIQIWSGNSIIQSISFIKIN